MTKIITTEGEIITLQASHTGASILIQESVEYICDLVADDTGKYDPNHWQAMFTSVDVLGALLGVRHA